MKLSWRRFMKALQNSLVKGKRATAAEATQVFCLFCQCAKLMLKKALLQEWRNVCLRVFALKYFCSFKRADNAPALLPRAQFN
jgi:hypothetical protein